MKKFFENTNVKATIILGIITTIICTYIIPAFIDISKYYTGNFISSLIDYYFRCAALCDGSEIIRIVTSVLYFVSLIYMISKCIEITKISKDLIGIIENKSDVSKKNEYEGKIKNYDDKKVLMKIKALSVIMCGLACIILIFTVIFTYSPIYTKKNFDLSVTKITPYVETIEVNLLKSYWVRMKTKTDYDEINQKIELIIEENNLD